MHRDKFDLPAHRLGDLDDDDGVRDFDPHRTGAVPMILGTIRWEGWLGRPQGPLDQAFAILVERLEVTKAEDRYPAQPQPCDCVVRYRDASDDAGPAVAYVVRGLGLLGFDAYPLDGHGHNMNGGYILTPSITALWDEGLRDRPFLSPLEFTPAKRGTPLTEANPIVTIDFALAPR
jgi:hypothetical protein